MAAFRLYSVMSLARSPGSPCNISNYHYCLASGECIVALGVTLSRCVCVRRISLGGEGNALYPVLSSYYCYVEIELKATSEASVLQLTRQNELVQRSPVVTIKSFNNVLNFQISFNALTRPSQLILSGAVFQLHQD